MNRLGNALRVNWRAFSLCAMIAAVGLLAGCMRPQAAADLTIVNGSEPESLDPAIVTGLSEMRITKALFEGLLRMEPVHARPVPGIAERWETSPDGTLWTFYLRSNAVWSTGQPITAEDFVYSWRRALAPETAADYAGQLFYIKNAEAYCIGELKDPSQVGVRARGPHVLEVELNHPLAFFLELCCFPTLAVVPRSVIEEHGDRWLMARPLPVSGPYELETWSVNDKVRLRKNERYWDAANTRSATVDVLPIGSPNAALNLYESRVADVIWDKDLVPTELMDVVAKRPDFHTFDFLGTYFYRFNVTRKTFEDARVRRAFALATDKERLLRKLTQGGEKPAWHFVPGGVANYEPPAGLSFDPEAARRLLAEAGYPGGKGFPAVEYSFFAAAGGAAKQQAKFAVELQEMWRKELGVKVGLRQIERKIFYSVQSRLDYDISASSWVGDYNDPNTFLDLYLSNSGNNRTGWRSAQYDRLVRAANREPDLQKRAGLFQQAERLLVEEDVPVVPLYFYIGFTFYRPEEITGIYPNLLDEHPIQYIGRKQFRRPSR